MRIEVRGRRLAKAITTLGPNNWHQNYTIYILKVVYVGRQLASDDLKAIRVLRYVGQRLLDILPELRVLGIQ